jgi:hypothetical protein
MATANVLYGRLGFDFDATKFGDAINLSNGTKEFLNTQPIVLTDWQISDLANSNVATSANYYRNPVLNVSNALKQSIQNLSNVILTIEFYDDVQAISPASNVVSLSANLILEIDQFISHTNNVSGVNVSSPTAIENTEIVLEYPDYEKVIDLGRNLVMLLKATDDREDASPVLASMTSIFIESDIANTNTLVVSDFNTINNSTRLVASNVYSNISATTVNSIFSRIQTANTLIGGRREHDWNFYREGLSLLNDYDKVSKLEDVGTTQEYLIKNYIGTESYINKLSANN